MHFLDKRVEVICAQLKKQAITQTITIKQWDYKEGLFLRPEEVSADSTSWQAFDTDTMHWYGKDRHYWFKTRFTVPQSLDGKNVWLRVRTQIDDWDDAKNPQFLVFINGAVKQGLDMHHREVLISSEGKAGEELSIELQAYSGILHSEFNLFADIIEIDPMIMGLYWDLYVPVSSFTRLDEDSRARRELERKLNEAVNLLDLREPLNNEYYASVKEARTYLEEELYSKSEEGFLPTASCIGHTHIDVAWWWTVAQTKEKVIRSFSTVLRLMEEYPEYTFMSSQPQLYQFLKDRYPDVYEEVKARIAEGRWEAEGGMWVEADCNLISGESMIRQFMHGKRFFKDEFNKDNKVLWLPDVFGYSAALPQIMKGCGIDYFMTTKLNWNQFDKMPHDTFMWKGIDGSEVLTHLVTTVGIEQPTSSFFTTYNGMLHPDALIGSWERYQDKDINDDILVCYGYGDGGGGPTRGMLENSKRLKKGVAGIPKVQQKFSGTYFEELEAKVKDHKRLARWEGELYFEYHRGTYTSMARNKRSNRKSEFALMDLELLASLCESAEDYPANDLDRMWKTVLINQFHDIIPGSSIYQVYEDTKVEYAELQQELEEKTSSYLHRLTEKSNDELTIFNTTGFKRSEVVEFDSLDCDALEDSEGRVYEVQKAEECALAFICDIPAKGYKTLKKIDRDVHTENVFSLVSDRKLETPYYSLTLSTTGHIESLFDKRAKRNVFIEGKMANLFRVYEDKPMYYDNWDIDIFYTEKFWDVDELLSTQWTEIGPVRSTLRMEKKFHKSKIVQDVHLYRDSARIDFETYVDWKEHQSLLKVHFPVDVHTDEACFDIQFGNLTRKTHKNTSWDLARFESCGHKWANVSEGGYGVSLINDCKYGHSADDSEIALTLIKSGIEPNPVTDQEEHYFTYSLYPHMGTWRESDTIQQAYFVNQKPLVVEGSRDDKLWSLCNLDSDNLVVETVKRAEDGEGIIVRLYEAKNMRTRCSLNWNLPYERAWLCDMLEEKTQELESLQFTVHPYEVVTLRIV